MHGNIPHTHTHTHTQGSGCGAVGKGVASDTRDPWFNPIGNFICYQLY